MASCVQKRGCGQTEAVPSGELVLGDGGQEPARAHVQHKPAPHMAQTPCAHPPPASYSVPSSTSQNMLFLLRMGCLCPPDHSHGNRQDAKYITATCRTQVVPVGYREAMKIKTGIKHEFLQSDSQMGKSNGCFAKQQLRARLPLTLGIIVMETTSKVAQNTSRYEKGS